MQPGRSNADEVEGQRGELLIVRIAQLDALAASLTDEGTNVFYHEKMELQGQMVLVA